MSRRYSEHERNVARRWWDSVGRGMVARTANPDETAPKVRTGDRSPGIVTHELQSARIPSGILNGLPFDQLTEREQMRVVECFQYARERDQYPERRTRAGEERVKRLQLEEPMRYGPIAVPWRH